MYSPNVLFTVSHKDEKKVDAPPAVLGRKGKTQSLFGDVEQSVAAEPVLVEDSGEVAEPEDALLDAGMDGAADAKDKGTVNFPPPKGS